MSYADCAFYASLRGSAICDCTKILSVDIRPTNSNESTLTKTYTTTIDWAKAPVVYAFAAMQASDCDKQKTVHLFFIPSSPNPSIFHPPGI